ncbi:HAMP domain-containing sensor histidine kinase [Cohnella nanjingensis]|uniref:histidine kinase n=2 Tax=Cohnella nanjingensis TaxID=1387779 RepID=A0A7X0VEL3_9BACL|nr:HAMP domain-containing sensor histidine kinase [Cohnella nanjingensis]
MRLVRNSKWEWAVFSGFSTVILFAIVYTGWMSGAGKAPDPEWWYTWGSAFLVTDIILAYMLGRRTQRRIDQLQLAMKQAAAGNWSSRLPDLKGDAFGQAYSDFNSMLNGLEGRLKLLQQLGERDINEEAPSHEAAVLEERRRLARDLHDTVSQQLFAIHMSASALPMLVQRNAAEADKVMRQLIDMSSSAQRQMRGLIAQLRPMELQGRTLTEALDRWFPDYCRQNGLQGTLDLQVSGRLAEAMEHQLFLIIQEAMANVVKHAEAKEVRLILGETDRQVTMALDDDGTGFSADRTKAGTYGLSTMRERAQKLGGEAEILTKPGSGTRVRVAFPKFAPAGQDSNQPKERAD